MNYLYERHEKHENLLKIIFWISIVICILLILQVIKKPEPIQLEPVFNIYITQEKENESDILEPRYGFTDDEIYLMAVLLSGDKDVDGDGEYDIDFSQIMQENSQQIALVLSVVMNRVESENFPNTVSEVIWAPGQFTPMVNWASGLPEVSDISLEKVRLWCQAYDEYNPYVNQLPQNHLYFYGNGAENISRERWYD